VKIRHHEPMSTSRSTTTTSASPDLRTKKRTQAMQDLLTQLQRDPRTADIALPIFRLAVTDETDPWTASSAAKGIGLILGPGAGREARRVLLRRPQSEVVAHAALDVTEPELVPELLNLLNRNSDERVKGAVIATLGRLRAKEALPALIHLLKCEPRWRQEVVEALGALGDPRAIEHLEVFERDTTVLGRPDERGVPLTLAHVVGEAIRHLRYRLPDEAETKPFVPSTNRTQRVSVLPRTPSAFPNKSPVLRRLLKFVAVTSVITEIPWVIMVVLSQWGKRGPTGQGAAIAQHHLMRVWMFAPVLLGFAICALLVSVTRTRGR
jgi:hypothetical protein